jgi:hypothetical protein
VIREVRPAHVLIEGPIDFGERLGELALGHELPIAIFTFYRDATRSHASWTPFCRYSPEWVAIEEGRAAGAAVRFCDLPAWHDAFAGRRNRYADRRGDRAAGRYERMVAALCARFRLDDVDALWDHLFEQPSDPDDLRSRLDAYFEELRGDEEAGPRDGPREELMARCIAWAMREAGDRDVVVVCGGWHAPALARRSEEVLAEDAFPSVSTPADEGARRGSYLVPYSFHRLDSFVGYESGLPSPAYYDEVWESGPEKACDAMLRLATERLRKKKQPVSTADLIACTSMARALARLRHHGELARTDLLDGIAGALVKDALEVALPWARRGPLLPRTEPLLVEVVASLSGDRRGRLAPGTPRPPLLVDAEEQLRQLGLAPTASARSVAIELTTETGREKSRLLHRLRVLGIPGFERTGGPARATGTELAEAWRIAPAEDRESALIEASGWGATLEAAAGAKLEGDLLLAGGRTSELAAILGEAVFVGIGGLAMRVLADVALAVAREPSFADLGAASDHLFDLFRHGDLLGATGAAQLAIVLEAAFDRGLWLLEGLQGGTAPADRDEIAAMRALLAIAKHGPPALAIAPARASAVMSRRAIDASAPPAIRGGALGFLWSAAHWQRPAEATEHAIRAVRAASRPAMLGDFLAGLFALAREEVLAAPDLVGAIDEILVAVGDDDLLVGLPSLRLAFSYFPPLERETIARAILARHGGDPAHARGLVRAEVASADVARGVELDGRVRALAIRYGLADVEGGP